MAEPAAAVHARGMQQSDDLRWELICRREKSGDFLYGVTSMGVYCRPGCPSPRPKRANVRFFAAAAEAEAAGFRPCRRCDPKGEREALAAEVVRRTVAAIDAAETAPPLSELAKRAGYSPFHFLRLFQARTGLTPRAYAAGVKRRRLQAELASGARVADAVAAAGYGSESRVYEGGGNRLGMTPGRARRGGKGETIRTAFARCPFGPLLIGSTGRGVCFLGFAEPEADLLADLKRRFPQASVEEDRDGLAATLAAVLAFLEEPKAALALPLDLRGSVFQMRVWEALRHIPPGRTDTYARIAASLGMPRGARAVGRACASNPVSLAVPCHRAVGTDGALHGYRWGLAQKQALLAAERRAAGED